MLYSRCLQGWRLAGVMFLCRWPAVFISRKSLNARNSISPPRFWLTGLLVLPPSPRKSCFRSEIAVYGPRERAARRRAKSRSLHSFEEAQTRLNSRSHCVHRQAAIYRSALLTRTVPSSSKWRCSISLVAASWMRARWLLKAGKGSS